MKRATQPRSVSTFFRLTTVVAAIGLVTLTISPAQAQTLTVLHNFTGADGTEPLAGITFDQQGRIYGTTYAGGYQENGVVYRGVREGAGWIFTPIYTFRGPDGGGGDGSGPLARVVFGPDGLLYGTTSTGGTSGNGTVFSLQPPASACKTTLCPWRETVLYNFDYSGGNPGYGDLVFDQAGNIYGTGFNGSTGGGIVFKLTRSGSGWTESVLWSFSAFGSEGSGPASGVIFDSAGNLYGTTSFGGAEGNGTVYELSPTPSGWTETTLYSFTSSDNGTGFGSLIMDAHGNLFGITGNAPGAAYELTPQNGSWLYKRLQTFSGGDSFGPVAPPTFDAQGNLYGPLPFGGSDQVGEIFKLTPSGNQWIYSAFYEFQSCHVAPGCEPFGAVTFDANGNMYGTSAGGLNGNVWEITP